MADDPRLDSGSAAYTRLTTTADQCLEQGQQRWVAALDRQATLLDALAQRGVAVASGSVDAPANASEAAGVGATKGAP